MPGCFGQAVVVLRSEKPRFDVARPVGWRELAGLAGRRQPEQFQTPVSDLRRKAGRIDFPLRNVPMGGMGEVRDSRNKFALRKSGSLRYLRPSNRDAPAGNSPGRGKTMHILCPHMDL